MKTLMITLVVLVTLGFAPSAQAQDNMPADIVSFFEGLAQISVDNGGNCDKMGQVLNEHLNTHTTLLRDAAYSDSSASAEQETAIMNAATTLGENAGACYESQEVITFMDRFVKLATEIDAGE